MRGISLFLLLAACGGCGGAAPKDPPSEYSISAEFTPEQAATIQDAVGAWCDAGVWCPRLVSMSARGHFAPRLDYDAIPNCSSNGSACNDWDNVWFDANGNAMKSTTALWLAAAHEAGHFGITGHPVEHPGLMAEWVGTVSTPMVVDAQSAAAWCNEGCN